MKVFISLPMANRNYEKQKSVREWISVHVQSKYESAEILNSFIEDDPPEGIENDGIGVWYLGKSIEILAQAHLAVFVPDWREARGCRIEHIVASAYGIPILEIPIA